MILKAATAVIVASLLVDSVESVPQQFSAMSEVGAHRRRGPNAISFAQLCENRKSHSEFATFPNVFMLVYMHRVVLNQI